MAAGGSAQQPERIRRIGVLWSVAESDAARQAQLSAFMRRLNELSWSDGRNVRLEFAGLPAVQTPFVDTRQSWWRSRRT